MPISEPSVTFSIIPAAQLAGVQEQKALIVGQMLAAGTATGGDLIQDHPDDGSEDALFGRTSHLAGMVRAFKRENKISQLDIIPLDDGSGTQGTGIITFTGSAASAAGSIFVSIGSEKDHRYEVPIAILDDPTDVGDTLAALVALDLDAPFTGANVTGTFTVTAENDGTYCNDWGIKIEGSVAGITSAITGWTGGATDPVLTTVLDVIANIRYQTIIWPSVYIKTEPRFAMCRILQSLHLPVPFLLETTAIICITLAEISMNSELLKIILSPPLPTVVRPIPSPFRRQLIPIPVPV